MLRRFHRWIDTEWLRNGLLNANPRRPPWRLELLPIGLVASVVPLDWLPISRDYSMWPMIALVLAAGTSHMYFIWRLQFIASMTYISQQLARGVEPDPVDVLKFTDPKPSQT